MTDTSNEFYGVNSVNDNFLIENVEENIKSFIDYGLTKAGGFINVESSIPTSGIYNHSFAHLRPVTDIAYGDNRVWQAPRNNWVTESGISFGGTDAIEFSGVYVDALFILNLAVLHLLPTESIILMVKSYLIAKFMMGLL